MARPIERIALVQVQVPFKDRPPGAAGDGPLREALLLSVETAEGVVGLGECCPADPAELPACWSELEAIAGRLLGRTLADPGSIGPLAEGFGAVRPPAAAAAETALWDVAGQQAHRSLAELLGASPMRIGLGVGGLLTMGLYPTVVDLIRAIEPHLAEGYRAVSVAIAPGRDLEFVGAVRQHYPELDLAVDAGGRFGPEDAEVFRRLDDQVDLWIEQPYAPGHLDAMAALQGELATALSLSAADEAALQRGACRMARLSIQELGGLGPARARHDRCCDFRVGCWVAVGPELGVGLAQALHLATLPNCKDPCGVAPATRWYVDDLVVPRIECDEPGSFRVAARPGLGHLLDAARVRPHQVRHAEWTAIGA